ncbi:nucleoprotein [Tahe rhabdovirus 1]|uniref:Nucleoprotein n=2 Tax=Rhabdoviridae TaxID=11270 RepID=A0A977TMQ5_9RHAB|nr:nucleoprotein [Tahe rhabdovirus 1]UYL95583.1 MAG: nucleocapsid [Yanbian Rhabd tick virus 4]WAK76840.1 MAG: nucleocapsid [Rhabdoviridae sp.]WNK16411.1 MAG: nucleoprotein [Manly virus]UXX18990.1 nucleoprotein [Tahe rhabdovirus 1]
MADDQDNLVNEDPLRELVDEPVFNDAGGLYQLHGPAEVARVAPEFPATWFAAQRNKPRLNCPVFQGLSPEDLRKTVHGGLAGGNLPADYAVLFLKVAAVSIQTTLTADLTSFGQTVGAATDVINPLSLLDVHEEPFAGERPACPMKDNPPSDAAMVAGIAVNYRLCVAKGRGGTETYLNAIKDRCVALLANPPFRMPEGYLDNWTTCAPWTSHREIQVILAAYDMLLYLDGNHAYGAIRAGTLVCRGRDCAILGDLQRAGRALGTAPTGVFYWCFSESLAPELKLLTTRGQELGDDRSYYHYLAPMALSRRSPYSASICPGIHLMCNAVAALLGIEEAQNTRYVACSSPHAVLTNAAMVAYANREGTGFRQMVTKGTAAGRVARTEWLASLGRLAEEEVVDGTQLPSTASPLMWCQFMRLRGWMLPEEIKDWASVRVQTFHSVRTGSVAEFVRNRFAREV